jgi:hypothetical protein
MRRPNRVIPGSARNLVTATLAVTFGFTSLILFLELRSFNLPGNFEGYEPDQPIAFSHLLHAGEMEVGCLYCHSAATKSRFAGIPSSDVCMKCHSFVTASLGRIRAEEKLAREEQREPRPVVSEEVALIYQSLGLNAKLERVGATRPIAWTRIHNLPDFAYFDHRAHVGAGVECQRCHGPVQTMEKVRQIEDLSMGWCVNCHRMVDGTRLSDRNVYPSIDCVTCHY